MTSIKNDRPAGAPRTTSTTGPAPTPDQSTVDDLDGVTDLEALEGMSLANATSFEAEPPASPKKIRSTTVAMPKPLTVDALAVSPNDITAVQTLVNATVGALKPGEKMILGAALKGAVEVAVGTEMGIEVSRRADGKFTVTLEQETFAGVGGSVGLGTAGKGTSIETRGGATFATSLSYVVDSPMEAAKLVAAAAAGANVGQSLPIPFGAAAGATAATMALASDNLEEVAVAAGFAVESEIKMEIFAALGAATSGAVNCGFVFVPPDQAFFEGKAKGTFAAENTLVGETTLGGGSLEGEVTVRVPLGRISSATALASPDAQKALLAKAGEKPPAASMSFEGTTSVSGGPAGINVEVTKEVEGTRLDQLFAHGGWQVQVNAELGGKIGGKVGPMTAEVTVQRNVKVYESTASSPADAAKQVKQHAADIEEKTKKAQQ